MLYNEKWASHSLSRKIWVVFMLSLGVTAIISIVFSFLGYHEARNILVPLFVIAFFIDLAIFRREQDSTRTKN